jgi:hypothetical protein
MANVRIDQLIINSPYTGPEQTPAVIAGHSLIPVT